MDVKVPDIGDFTDVPVVSVLVAVGDTVSEEDPLIELESDKATMEVPSPAAGKVTGIAVSEGDAVSEGAVILTLEGADAGDGAGQRRRTPSVRAARSRVAMAAAGRRRRTTRRAPLRLPAAPLARATFRRRWLFWAPALAVIRPPSGRRISARRWC